MPTPGQHQRHMAMPSSMLDAPYKKLDDSDLAREIAELREEIMKLRAELAPVPSLIVTGQQALDEFKRLAHACP